MFEIPIKRNGIGKEFFVMLRFMVDKLRESCPSWRRPRLELLQVCLPNIPLQGRNEMFWILSLLSLQTCSF